MTPQISQLQKELTDRRTKLALQYEIPDMAAHAMEWQKLGADFAAAGWKNNAEICYSNAQRYGAMDPGTYQRLLEEIPVRLEKSENIKECVNCRTYTKHVMLATPEGTFVGWMCGCGTLAQLTAAEAMKASGKCTSAATATIPTG